jgi:ADP-ribose pyrophosphatase YjhB (NUDIX family)
MAILDGWKFCPRCATAIVAAEDHVSCPSCRFVGWANSVPGVQALVERDGMLLLVRRALDPGRGKWDLPGGFLREGEHPADGLLRELREETGLDVALGPFVGVWLDPYEGRTVLGLTYAGTAAPGAGRAADDVAQLAWFRPDELPAAGEFAFPSHSAVVSLWRDQHT